MGIEVRWSRDGLDAMVSCDCKTCKGKKMEHCAAYEKARETARKEETKRNKAEAVRQKNLAAQPRSNAKVPEAAKLHATLSSRKIEAWYGRHGLAVLTTIVEKYNDKDEKEAEYGPFIRKMAFVEQRGKPKVYEVVEALPTLERFNELRDLHYATTIGDLIEEANSDVQDLASEIREWHDNMPEGFQNASKGEEVNECADALEAINSVEVDDAPEAIKEIKIVYLPILDLSSRGDRMASAIDRYTKAADRLEQAVEKKELTGEVASDAGFMAEECRTAANDGENVSFPGMY